MSAGVALWICERIETFIFRIADYQSNAAARPLGGWTRRAQLCFDALDARCGYGVRRNQLKGCLKIGCAFSNSRERSKRRRAEARASRSSVPA